MDKGIKQENKKIITYPDKVKKAENIIKELIFQHNNEKIAVACSFGKDSLVVLDLFLSVSEFTGASVNIISILTPFKPLETFKFREEVIKYFRKKYRDVDILFDLKMANGTEKIYLVDVEKCCQKYKVEMTNEVLKNFQAWISGVRNTEGRERRDFKYIEEGETIIKYNPILDFTEVDIWKYTANHNLPIHPWYLKGYRSLGCEPCTALIGDDQSERDGRWAGTCKQGGECGIHKKKF